MAKKSNFQQLDLNLLRTLVVLFKEKNTRRAAEVLFTTQPSVSRSLAKLRHHFKDELFTRTQYGLAPTDRCIEINRTLPLLMQTLEQTLSDTEFEPSELTGTLRIATNHFLGDRYNSKLFLAITEASPKLTVEFENWNSDTALKLLNGQLQAGINYFPIELSKEIFQRKLMSESFSLYMRSGHPYLSSPSLKTMVSYPLATVLVPDWNLKQSMTEKLLLDHDVECQFKLRSENINSIFQSLKDSDLIFPAAHQLLDNRPLEGVISVGLPDDFKNLEMDISLYMHVKHRQSPYYQWLASIMQNCLS
ncbi:LysR family transcriptional regulator [Vibrio ouci]|uniref:LysR family transcriptional regulator n=1 Tax=Vibrio ouci TaxID=2499078 RepID=A0A4Y8WKK7_9VIBR|nr:LysR family transcriptional regulator [Vibrio ouci]TFH93135.1 LysR family transcriptional regulator [Vibrio ouci]